MLAKGGKMQLDNKRQLMRQKASHQIGESYAPRIGGRSSSVNVTLYKWYVNGQMGLLCKMSQRERLRPKFGSDCCHRCRR
eukprot:8833376-Heterocapsa_arctica.AAC.1